MFNSKTELLEWHQKGIVNTLSAAVWMVTMYHCGPVEIFKTLKLQRLIGMN
jgi:hypothetical protein